MRAFVVTPPAPVVTWEEADAHLKLDGNTDEKSLVEGLIAAATDHIDGPSGWLGRAIGVQTIEARFDCFTSASRPLPYPPVISVTDVKYLSSDNVATVLAADQYELMGDVFGAAWGATWPNTLSRPEAVRIRYQAGYGDLPPAIRAAILLMVGDLYANRETVIAGVGVAAVPMSVTVSTLLAPFKVFR